MKINNITSKIGSRKYWNFLVVPSYSTHRRLPENVLIFHSSHPRWPEFSLFLKLFFVYQTHFSHRHKYFFFFNNEKFNNGNKQLGSQSIYKIGQSSRMFISGGEIFSKKNQIKVVTQFDCDEFLCPTEVWFQIYHYRTAGHLQQEFHNQNIRKIFAKMIHFYTLFIPILQKPYGGVIWEKNCLAQGTFSYSFHYIRTTDIWA